jgi:hypothetical protein
MEAKTPFSFSEPKKGLNSEDLAIGQANINESISHITRYSAIALATAWVGLLIMAADIRHQTYFLMINGGLGLFCNLVVIGWHRDHKAWGIPAEFQEVFGESKVMNTLYALEKAYAQAAGAMLSTFFPGNSLRPDEKAEWEKLDVIAKEKIKAAKALKEAEAGAAAQTWVQKRMYLAWRATEVDRDWAWFL